MYASCITLASVTWGGVARRAPLPPNIAGDKAFCGLPETSKFCLISSNVCDAVSLEPIERLHPVSFKLQAALLFTIGRRSAIFEE
jgi:hypothetical protein